MMKGKNKSNIVALFLPLCIAMPSSRAPHSTIQTAVAAFSHFYFWCSMDALC